jgi:hypothetical protein
MDTYFTATKPIDEGMYTDDAAGNFDDFDDDMGVGSGEATMRIDSSSVTGSMSHHSTLLGTEKIVHTDFFNDFIDLFDTDSFAVKPTCAPVNVTA